MLEARIKDGKIMKLMFHGETRELMVNLSVMINVLYSSLSDEAKEPVREYLKMVTREGLLFRNEEEMKAEMTAMDSVDMDEIKTVDELLEAIKKAKGE